MGVFSEACWWTEQALGSQRWSNECTILVETESPEHSHFPHLGTSGPLLDSTIFYQDSTSLYYTLHYSTMVLLHSTRLYITLPWLYFTLHNSTMAILLSTWQYIIIPWLYFLLLDPNSDTMSLYFTLLDSTLLHYGSTSLYWTLHYSTMTPLHSTRHYITLPWHYFTLHCSTMGLHHTTLLYT